jgi:hypothetical protein
MNLNIYFLFLQLIAYEKSLFGFTTVSFVDTSFDSVPDIYLSTGGISNSRRQTLRTPNQITNKTLPSFSRSGSFISRSPTNILPTSGSRIFSSNINHRPLSSKNYMTSSFLHDPPDQRHYNSFESIHEPFLSTRLNVLRTGKYVPPFFNRFYLP